jgi:hypothetical protein
MNNQTEEHNMGSTLWQSQSLDAPRISLEFVRHQADRLNADLRHELIGAYLGVAISVIALVWAFFALPGGGVNPPMTWVLRATVLLSIPASLYSLFQVKNRNNKLSVAASAQVVPSLDAYRQELKGRQDFYASALWWSLLPIMPSTFVFVVGVMLFEGSNVGKRFGVAALMAVVFLLGGWYYRWKLTKFKRELDAVATMDNQSESQRPN